MVLRVPIPSELKKEIYNLYSYECVDCGEKNKKLLQIHHIDEDPSNNDITNLEIVCVWCHALGRHPFNAENIIIWAIKKGIIE
ncbi:MAG: HNH endonuclease [Nanoarchaeota archaeon]